MVAEADGLKKFDLVEGRNVRLGIIVSEAFTAHFFDSCIASQAAEIPFDLSDPNAYEIEVNDMVLVHVFIPEFGSGEVEAVRLCNLRPAKFDYYNANIPFDHATARLRELLSVKLYAEKLGREKPNPEVSPSN